MNISLFTTAIFLCYHFIQGKIVLYYKLLVFVHHLPTILLEHFKMFRCEIIKRLKTKEIFTLFFREKKGLKFQINQADDSHNMSSIFSQKKKRKEKMSSAAVAIGDLRVLTFSIILFMFAFRFVLNSNT